MSATKLFLRGLLFLTFLGSSSLPAWTLISSQSQGWATGQLSVGVNTTGCSVPEADLLDAIDAAFDLWNSTTTSEIKLTRRTSTVTATDFLAGSASEVPVILCDTDFSTNNGVSADSIPGLAQIGSGTQITYGGIVLNAESGGAANIGNISNDLLRLTVAHELGHLLGLGHSGNQGSLMYFSITGKSELYLAQDDLDGISFLYPRRELSQGSFGCAGVAPSSFRPSHSVYFVCIMLSFIVIVLLIGRWIREDRPS